MSSVNARVPPSRLAAIDSPADGEVAAYQSSSGQFEWVANGSGGGGSVTSVALTESGNALTITGSPITGSGTLNISGAGSSSQVILGDLTLATLPTGTIGGSSTANQVSFGDTTANEITSSNNFQFLSNQNLYVGGRIQIGNGTGTKLTTVSGQNLILDTNEGTDSGSIVIEAGTNGQISITPDGTGLVKIDGVGINNSAIATGYILKATSTTEAGWVAESAGGGFTGSLADTQVAFGNTTADSIQGSSSLTVTGSGSSFQLNNNGGYKAKNGTPSAPSYHMTGDADTGMYLISNGRLGFATNGERQVQIRDAHMTLGGNGYSTQFIIDAEDSSQDLSLRSGGGDAGGVQYAEILLQPDNGNIEVRPEGTGKIQFHDAYTFPTAVTAANDYVLTAQTDGTTAWAAAGGGGGGSPGGSDTQIQYNNGGSFGGSSVMTFDDTGSAEQVLFSGTSSKAIFKVEQLGAGNSIEVHDASTDTTIFLVDQFGRAAIKTNAVSSGYDLTVGGSTFVQGHLKLSTVGTTSAPAIKWDGDTTTGINKPTSGEIAIVSAGTETFRFGANNDLEIAGNAGSSGQVFTSGGAGAAASWTTPSGGGGIGGSITDNQVAVGSSTTDEIEGSSDFTYNASTDTLTVGEKIDSSGTSPLLLAAGSSLISVLDGGVANHINISPASGRLNAQSSLLSLGTGLTNSTISSNGAYDLTLNTNDGTNSGAITITDGVDGNIALTPNGAGAVVFRSPRVSSFDTPASASAAGVTGSLAFDENYIYVCTATDTWKRVALSTW